MRSATDLLVQYAHYHRDRRNIATHFVGIPMIVFAIGVLLARATVEVMGMTMTAGWLAAGLATLWYLTRGRLDLGLAISAATLGLVALAHEVAGGPIGEWLAWGLGFFVVGWVLQFIGHYYEGRKPAFVDDLVGLLVGPMFVMAEALFAIGWGRSLREEIERQAGPTHIRDLKQPAVTH
ncbi:MAG TPA: Mpo1-like protein [Ideonella sp.]|jgi:uncharacterized membrane protein YGL010W|nr:Mpo1-like protein [Ideonella sp.]